MTACDFASIRLLQRGEERVERKWHLGNEGEVHILARDRRARGDESGVAAHEFDESDAARHAARLGVRAIEHARGLLDGGEESEGARDEADVVVDRLRHADDGERVAAAARFLVESVGTALRAVAADGEEDVHAARDKVVHGSGRYRPARARSRGSCRPFDECHQRTPA